MVPYEKGTPTTIEGRILSVHTDPNPVVSELGLHLTVETSGGEYIVHVSPQWYADQQQFQFVKGEYLTITGSFFLRDQQKNIYAATIVRRFSALSGEQQIRLACEAVSSPDLKALAAKYAVDLEEVERIKSRAEHFLDSALFPDPIRLRDPQTGDGLWGGRYYHENMPLIRKKMQEEKRKKIRERSL